jgi:acyl-[acyl-carrier-protein] desaturase
MRPALAETLNECAGHLLERHLAHTKEWFPHELVPWDLGRRYVRGQAPPPEGPSLPDGVLSALFVNLLTEDNLPHYFHNIASAFGTESALAEWSRRWAAEEQRHAIVLRDWISVTRMLDLFALERARMRHVSAGFDPGIRALSMTDGIVYLTLQELATRISHWNTGRCLDESGAAVMKRVAADENLHFLFYRDLTTAALNSDPSGTVKAIDRQVTCFQMPGSTMDGFTAHAVSIAAAGIYDFRVHYEQVLLPVVMTHWRLESIEGLDGDAERAREHLVCWIARMRRIASRMEAQSAEVRDGRPRVSPALADGADGCATLAGLDASQGATKPPVRAGQPAF